MQVSCLACGYHHDGRASDDSGMFAESSTSVELPPCPKCNSSKMVITNQTDFEMELGLRCAVCAHEWRLTLDDLRRLAGDGPG